MAPNRLRTFLLLVYSLLLCGMCEAGQDYYPPDSAIVHCKMVSFTWPHTFGASGYQLQVTSGRGDNMFENNIVDSTISPPGIIIREGLNFSNAYSWRIRPIIMDEDTTLWQSARCFSIIDLPDSLQEAFQTEVHDQDNLQAGYTVTSAYGTVYGFNAVGEIYWYIPGPEGWFRSNFDIRMLPTGKFLSNHSGGVRIFTVNDETLWHSDDYGNYNFHHEVFPMPGGTFLGVRHNTHRRIMGEDTTLWKTDYLQEIDRNGNEVWRWDCWEHISHEDYDSVDYAQVPPGGLFGWTHANACPFDPRDNSIYFSIRNLNRIVKIAYPSGDIVWSMGTEMISGDVDFGNNLEFYRQHAPQPLPNGNLLLYDNHWYHANQGDHFSRAIEIEFDNEREEPAEIAWQYRHEFSSTQGDADRLENGNTLIATGGTGSFYEVNSEGELLWEAHTNFRAGTYRSERIADFYPYTFVVSGPPEQFLVPRWDADLSYTVYNIGSGECQYVYRLIDDMDWFESASDTAQIRSGDSLTVTFHGLIPFDDNLLDTLRFQVHILGDIDEVKEVISIISPDPASSVIKSSKKSTQYSFLASTGLNQSNRISFFLPRPENVQVRVYDIRGRLVKTIIDRMINKGEHSVTFCNYDLAAGTYFIQLKTGSRIICKPMLLFN